MDRRNKIEKYKEMLKQVAAFTVNGDDRIAVMANVTAVLKMTFPETFFWVGFYVVNGEALMLGPFQGLPACMMIKYGKGVCGTAWARRETIIVPDVELFDGHIACSSLSRSEIVVPVMIDGEVVAEIDIDSTDVASFDETDRAYLEEVAAMVAPYLGKR
ncbi:MAG: GAF domain-containing protein [Prevotella sp.]